jgi:hypothetical protein
MKNNHLNKRTDYKKITMIASCCALVSCCLVSEIHAATGLEIINGVFDQIKISIMTKLLPVGQLMLVSAFGYKAYQSGNWLPVVGGGVGAGLLEVFSRSFGS